MTSISSNDFKAAVGSFATGVTIVTTLDNQNTPHGVTISSFCSLSLTPPMVLFCLQKDTLSHEILTQCDYFGVNILSQKQSASATAFAFTKECAFKNTNHHSSANSCPILHDICSFIECQRKEVYDGGDHSIITGQAINLLHHPDKSPLIYHKGNYHSLGE